MGLRNLPQVCLRLGLAFTFLYATWSSFQNPLNWIGFFPAELLQLTSGFLSHEQLLLLFSAVQVCIALLLITGKQLQLASLAAAAMLGGIVWFNLGAMDILFRDIGLLLAALALFGLARQ